MRKTLLCLTACALALATAGRSSATEPASKPVAIVSVASYKQLLQDVGCVGKIADRPKLGNALEGFVAMVTQGKGLLGVDESRPWGAVAQADGETFSGYAFVPVTDFKAMLSVLALYAKIQDQGSGVHMVVPKDGGKTSYVKSAGGWAFFAEKAAILDQVVANPASLLGGLDNRYLVSGRFFLDNVPAQLRAKAMDEFQHKARRHMKHGSNQNEVGEDIVKMMVATMNDIEQVTFGWGLDTGAEKAFADLSVKAREGTPTAMQLSLMDKATSSFAGFRLPGAALVGNLSGTLSTVKIERLSSLIDAIHAQALSDAQKKTPPEKLDVAKDLIDTVAKLLKDTVKSGRADGAVAVLLEPEAVTGLAAVYVADGALAEKVLRTIAEAAEKENPVIADWIKFDADSIGSFKLHTLTIPVPADGKDREKFVPLIGDKLEVVFGIGPQSVAVAAGRDAMGKLKAAIEASAANGAITSLPLDVAVATERLMRFAAAVGNPQDRPKAAFAADELKKSPGRDRISLVARPIPSGVQYHFEVEQGIIRTIGAMIEKKSTSGE